MTCLKFGGVMLPSEGVDLSKFATVACDQFTSDINYWDTLDRYVGEAPSALRITYPEIFLNDDPERRIAGIVEKTDEYLKSGVFSNETFEAVLTERKTPYTKSRLGLVVGIDLDAYTTDEESPVRATEAVVKERIPPRVKIRSASPLEFPHIMLLCRDPEGVLIEAAHRARGRKLYDFELNMGGGSIAGYEVGDVKAIERAAEYLAEKSAEDFGKEFLFAVGDGNHSLAAAKTLHELHPEIKELSSALCEIVNVCSDGITFHPIHRLAAVKNVKDFIRYMQSKTAHLPVSSALFSDGERYTYNLPADAVDAVELVQSLVDAYGCESVDYIHGDKQLETLSAGGNVGIKLFAPDKTKLFEAVARRGKLPKKTFSIGEGEEKRYYLEARRIMPQ